MKQFVCVHYPTAYSKPVGIWWWDPGQGAPTSYYLPGAESYHASAVGVLGSAKDETQWNSWAARMADRTPVSSSFSVDEIDISPITYLKALVKEVPIKG